MKKTLLILGATLTLGLSTTQAHWNNHYDDFHSWNKPTIPKMAEYNEMVKYQNDLETYLKSLDAEIAKINAKKSAAIAEYNSIATQYNNDQFFHKGNFKLKHMPHNCEEKDKNDSVIVIFK